MPNKRNPNMSDYKVRMPREWYSMVRELADGLGISAQELMRQAIADRVLEEKGDRLLNAAEAAVLLGVSYSTLHVTIPRDSGHQAPAFRTWRGTNGYHRPTLLRWARRTPAVATRLRGIARRRADEAIAALDRLHANAAADARGDGPAQA